MVWERFDSNEWFVFLSIIAAYATLWKLPKRVPTSWMLLSLLWGVASASVFDFTIGGGLLDYYRINDSNGYELMDAFTYVLFAPFGYFFIYGYELLRITRRTLILYIAGWAVVGMAYQWMAERFGATDYQNGYQWSYNLVAFLITQTVTGLFYAYMREHAPHKQPAPPAPARFSRKKASASPKFRRARRSPV